MDIRKMRKDLGMTQASLAKSAGVSLISVVRYESGTRRPTPETAKKLAAVLGVPWTKFFDDTAP